MKSSTLPSNCTGQSTFPTVIVAKEKEVINNAANNKGMPVSLALQVGHPYPSSMIDMIARFVPKSMCG
jgi:hypothetical protein